MSITTRMIGRTLLLVLTLHGAAMAQTAPALPAGVKQATAQEKAAVDDLPNAEARRAACTQQLQQAAVKANQEPNIYIAHNQTWLIKCMHPKLGIR